MTAPDPSAEPPVAEPDQTPDTEPAPHRSRRVLIIAGVAALIVTAAGGWVVYDRLIKKDSGIAACEAMRDGTGTGANQGSDQLTEQQYQQTRALFKDSRHEDIREHGTALVDLYWQMQSAGAGEDLSGLVYLSPLIEHSSGLQAACLDHGVMVQLADGTGPNATGTDAPTVEASPEPAPPRPVRATVTLQVGDPVTDLVVNVMWTRCVLSAPDALDADYDGTPEVVKPGEGNRICVSKYKVRNTGRAPAPYSGGSDQLVTSAGTFQSSGTAFDLAGALWPVEGENKMADAGLNPKQTGYEFAAWEVPDDATIQAVQFEDGQRLAVKAERRSKL